MAFAAIGPIVYPIIISFLLSEYSAQSCIAIMVAISGHTIVAALLLQPVKWHLKRRQSNAMNTFTDSIEKKDLNKVEKQSISQMTVSIDSINNKKKSIGQKIVDLFDLNILRDKTCLNVIVGLSCADFAEFNFMAITPLILIEMNYKTVDTASIMSIMAIADVVLRFLSPFIEHYLRQKPRTMLLYSLIVFVLARLGK